VECTERRFRIENGANPLLTTSVLWQGPADAQMRLSDAGMMRAFWTADGAASLELRVDAAEVTARAWGPGAGAALAAVPGLIGLLDDPTALVPSRARGSRCSERRRFSPAACHQLGACW